MPLSFRIDEALLKKRYLQNSKKYHPDFHTLSDEDKQADMLERATYNNEAFKTLSDPEQRMRYILTIKGLLNTEGEEKATLPQDFLMDMMEVNEALMELEFDFDPVRYADTLATVQTLEQDLENKVQPLLDSWSETSDTLGALTEIRNFFWKKRYLLRISENLSKFAPAFEKQ